VVLVLGTPLSAQHPGASPPPGFRPPTAHDTTFLASLPDAHIVVLPTTVRTVEGATSSRSSQASIVELLNHQGVADATAGTGGIDLGPAPHTSQWEIFQGSLHTLAAALEGRHGAGDYSLMLELVLPPGAPRVFGIETYVLDRNGQNAFSFLLNSHHPIFVEADLVAADGSTAAREAMIAKATRVGMEAFLAQIDWARECAAWMEAHPPETASAGVIQDFETGLPSLQDAFGVPLGFSTFSDGHSSVRMATTGDHPPREGEAAGNHALQIDLQVSGWAGFTYLVHDPSTETWRSQDWRAIDGISFWIYGRETGAAFYVHVFDNRNPCSTRDDAERYGYEFTDDFSGWKQIVIPFDDMVRAEVGNGAPQDGFHRDRVHGWAFGATDTGGPGTWYLDDIRLWTSRGG
jgi:hypothetical protein